MKILITGTQSGIGKYLYENLDGIAITRETSEAVFESIKTHGVDTIIHCAFNSNKYVTTENLYKYISDNLFLTKKLTECSNNLFVYFSSVDVYPEHLKLCREDNVIDMGSVKSFYGVMKLIGESVVRECCKNYLILRTTALLGKYARKNSLMKIITEDPCILTLSEESVFNYILYHDVLSFIKLAIEKRLTGIYNLSSSENITLFEVANILKKNVKFGHYIYNVGNIDNSKALSVYDGFKKSSLHSILEYIK